MPPLLPFVFTLLQKHKAKEIKAQRDMSPKKHLPGIASGQEDGTEAVGGRSWGLCLGNGVQRLSFSDRSSVLLEKHMGEVTCVISRMLSQQVPSA